MGDQAEKMAQAGPKTAAQREGVGGLAATHHMGLRILAAGWVAVLTVVGIPRLCGPHLACELDSEHPWTRALGMYQMT